MTAKNREILLILLCGLPASGKSHLCQLLCEKYPSISPGNYATIAVCYDRLLPAQQLIEQCHNVMGLSRWKQYRESIVEAVDALVAETLNVDVIMVVGTDRFAMPARSADVPSIENTLRKENERLLEMLPQDDVCRVVFVIDDNMYFNSMRYAYYRLARKYNIGFCQIHVRCDLDTALRRNRSRSGSAVVDDNVIWTMWDKFELPNRSARAWEAMSLTLDNNVDDNFKSCWSSLDDFLGMAFKCPVPRHIVDDEQGQKASSQLACRRSVLHQVDVGMRKLVSKAAEKNSTKSNVDRLNAARREVLADIRSGIIVLEEDLLRRIDEETDSISEELSHFLEAKLNDDQ